jgi:hypothetical protein
MFASFILVLGSVEVGPAPAYASDPAISGAVKDAGDVEQPDVLVEVLNPGGGSVVASTTTGPGGTFHVPVSAGTYDLRFTPPADSGLRSYLATGVNTDTAGALTVVLKSIQIAHLQGALRDSRGNPRSNCDISVGGTSPGSSSAGARTDSNGHYAVTLLAGTYRFAVYCIYGGGPYVTLNYKTGVVIDQDLTHDLTINVSTLRLAVRDASGNPVAGAGINLNGSIDQPDYIGYAQSSVSTDETGNGESAVITGFPAQTNTLSLPGGLNVALTLSAINGDKIIFLIFDETTGAVYVDDQAPVVVGTPDRSANDAGWYHAPVTIIWKSLDPRPSSGTPTRPADTTIATEGANQTATSAQSCDPAGNCATGTYPVSIDTTAPTVTATVSSPPNADGWYKQPVTVSFTCADALSGIADCPDPVTINTDGANQNVTGTAVDRAGNIRTAVATVSMDRTAPTITAIVSQASNGGGWNNADVTVTFQCADALAGVASCPQPVTLTEDGANQEVTGTALDRAGNSTTTSVTVSIDKSKPFIVASRTAANSYGWNNTNVTVTYTCTDAVSGIASCSDPAAVSAEGAAQSRTGTAVNHAGLTATATVDDINIDRTPPSVTASVVGTKNAAGWY